MKFDVCVRIKIIKFVVRPSNLDGITPQEGNIQSCNRSYKRPNGDRNRDREEGQLHTLRYAGRHIDRKTQMNKKGETQTGRRRDLNQPTLKTFLSSFLIDFIFFNSFWWNRSPYCLYFPLPPLRGQPTAQCHPRWQPISGQQSTVGWGDCSIRTQDCSFTIWCRYQ